MREEGDEWGEGAGEARESELEQYWAQRECEREWVGVHLREGGLRWLRGDDWKGAGGAGGMREVGKQEMTHRAVAMLSAPFQLSRYTSCKKRCTKSGRTGWRPTVASAYS